MPIAAVAREVTFGPDHRIMPNHSAGCRGRSLIVRAACFNVFNRANVLARNSTYGDTGVPLSTFGQATPGLASIDAARMAQFQLRLAF